MKNLLVLLTIFAGLIACTPEPKPTMDSLEIGERFQFDGFEFINSDSTLLKGLFERVIDYEKTYRLDTIKVNDRGVNVHWFKAEGAEFANGFDGYQASLILVKKIEE